MKKLLITGFEPFLDYEDNPSEELAFMLSGKDVGDYHVSGMALPVVYEKSFTVMQELLDQKSFDVIVHAGLSADRDYISVETKAVNVKKSEHKDNEDNQFDGEAIVEGAPESFQTKIDTSQINIDGVQISEDCGTYVCNDLYYRSLAYFNNTETKVLFVHVPDQDLYELERKLKLIIKNIS